MPTPVGFIGTQSTHQPPLTKPEKEIRPDLPESIIPPGLKGYPLTELEKDCIISNHILLHFMKEAAKAERAIFGADRTDAFAHYA